MDDNLYIQTTEAEIERLRAELARNPAFMRLRLLEKHLAEYRAIVPGPAPKQPAHPVKDLNRYGRPGSRAAVIVEASEAILKRAKKRLQTGAIVEQLIEAGIGLPDQPIAVVSSYLSTSPLFDNVKGEGYGLVEWHREKV